MNVIDIVQIIAELESVAGAGTRVPGLRKRVMVDSGRLLKVAEELRRSIPSDIQEAVEVIKQKDSIINQAQLEGRRIKESAQQECASIVEAARREQEARVDETEIVREAMAKAENIAEQAHLEAQQGVQDSQQRAYKIMDEADAAAATRRSGADQYARETLFDIEERLASQLAQVRRGIDSLGVDADVRIPA